MIIYGEVVRYPLSVIIKQKMVCYWIRILKNTEDKLNKVMHIILYKIYCKNVHSSPWIRCGSYCFQNNGINYIWITHDFNIYAKLVYKCECGKFKQLWHSNIINGINDNNAMYKCFKYSHGKERYMETLDEHFKKH